MKEFLIRYLKFGSVGFWGSLVQMAVLFLLSDLLKLDYRLAMVIAIECRIVNNFIINYHWTWHDARVLRFRRKARMFLKFNASSMGLSLLITWTVAVILTEYAGFNHNVSNFIGLLAGNVGSVINFTLSHFLIFRRHQRPAPSPLRSGRPVAD